MMRVAIYARYSTDMQKPETIAVQNGNTRAYIARHGWHEVAAYADEAISGSTLNRPGIRALLAACAAENDSSSLARNRVRQDN